MWHRAPTLEVSQPHGRQILSGSPSIPRYDGYLYKDNLNVNKFN